MKQAGVLETAWHHRFLVAAIVLAFGVGAALLSASRPPSYEAVATVVLQDPGVTNVLGAPESSDRIVANQIEVFRSGLTASDAAVLASAEGYGVTAAEVISNATFTTLRGTDVITVTYPDPDQTRAEVIVNSIVTAYDQVQRDQRRAANASVLETLDSAEEVLLADLLEVRGQIDDIRAERAIGEQIEETLNRVSVVQDQLLQETDQAIRDVLAGELVDLRAQMESLRLASEIEDESVALSGLLATRESLQPQLTSIENRRTELEIETAIESSGIAFYSPASATDVTSGAGLMLSTLGGVLLGGMLALGIAYALVNWRRQFSDSSEPESVLEAPFLAEIPRWSRIGKLTLPVRDDPRSPIAEAFRFASASIDIRLGSDNLKSVNFVAATTGQGKSTLVANTALAAARTGKRVLLVDADFSSQVSSKLLVDNSMSAGLTDLVMGNVTLQSAVSTVALPDAGTLHVMGRGVQEVAAPDFFANPLLKELMLSLEAVYDLVLVDGPPLLQVAYASTIARLTDALVIVVTHGSRTREAGELLRRIRFIGTPAIGYIYNQAPRHAGRHPSGGSMEDVLGDRGLTIAAPAKRSR